MAASSRTITLSPEQASYIDDLVAAGAYASPNDVVDAGLLALRERDAGVENWLHDDVASEFDALTAGKAATVPADKVFAELRARHAARLKTGKREP